MAAVNLFWLVACGSSVPSGPALTAWFGDPHVHTGASGDGCSSDMGVEPGELCGAVATIGQDAAAEGLSWFTLADHLNGPHARTDTAAGADWRALIDAGVATEEVLVLAGGEAYVSTPDGDLGHYTVIFFADALPGLTRDLASPSGSAEGTVASCDALRTWVDGLSAWGPSLVVPHHPASLRPMAVDWSCLPAGAPVVEVYSHWGNGLAWQSAAEPHADYDPLGTEPDETVVESTVVSAMAAHPEFALGFVAGTDGHRTGPGKVCDEHAGGRYGGGLTGALLPEGVALTRAALFDAFQARHTYATTGPRVALHVDVIVGDSVVGTLGDQLSLPGKTEVLLRLQLADALTWESDVASVSAIQPGVTLPEQVRTTAAAVGGGRYEATIVVDPDTAPTYAYFEVVLAGAQAHPADCVDEATSVFSDDTERVWTSPTWFSRS